VRLGQYFYYDAPANGDLHVLVPGRFLAFRGPRDDHGDWLDASSYINAFRSLSVHTVVRLNKPEYDKAVFTSAGFEHLDLPFEDCTVPPLHIVDTFLRTAENLRPGQMMAVHCLAGLGRTGTLIAMFMMKHFGFSANEAIGWLRICRPGSIIGPQQQFLADEEKRMHRLGAEQTPGLGDNFDKIFSPKSSCVSPRSLRAACVGKRESTMLADQVTDGMMNRSERKQSALGSSNDHRLDATTRHRSLPWLKHRLGATQPQTSSTTPITTASKLNNSETNLTAQHTTTTDQHQAKPKGSTSSPDHPHHSRSYKDLPNLNGIHSGMHSLMKTGSFNNMSSLSSRSSFDQSSRFSSRTSFLRRRPRNSSISSMDDHSKHTVSDDLPPQPSSAVSVTSVSRRRPSASYSRGACPPKLKLSHKERQILEQGTFPPIRVLPTLAVA